ncbi:MAG: agmatine deiminase family protein [Acidiferrobacterales bacterium]|jgi:agmatine deiminase|nr:agmatine deiminase family protein [Acidiferrobacterales bacterium]
MSHDCRTYLPPEWAPQSGVQLTWPHAHGDWAKNLAIVEPVFVDLATNIARFERVLIVCRDATHQQHINSLLAERSLDPDRVRYVVAPSNDTWARDHGALTVICSGEPQLLDFQFNGWGGKYDHDLDNAITPAIYRAGMFGDTPMETVNLILEGGAVEVDGSGTLLATRSSVLSSTRNGDLPVQQMEQQLSHYLGIERFLWLDHGTLSGDDTDGHIDTLARFCDRDTIAYCHSDNPDDMDHAELVAMREELAAFRSITGDPYRLVPLPMPETKVDEDGKRLPATYANFLIINDAVLVPTYEDPADTEALSLLQQCFPGREVIGVNALPLILQYGSLHCVTMQFPEGVII